MPPLSLSSLLHISVPTHPSPEDIFSSALDLLFPDDISVLHGDPGSTIIYKSPRFGDVELRLPEPGTEDERRLFAQFLWNAGVVMVGFLEGGMKGGGDGEKEDGKGGGKGEGGDEGWSVVGEKVLELGAGTGLAGIVSALAGAQEVVISDYPSREILATLETNCRTNIIKMSSRSNSSSSSSSSSSPEGSIVRVVGHEWGVIDDSFSKANARRFTRILAADCLWMAGEHANLVTSMLHFLTENNPNARVWVVAGFHTGRAPLAGFFEVARARGLETLRIWEYNTVSGDEREWVAEPKASKGRREDIAQLKRWVVVAILGRKGKGTGM